MLDIKISTHENNEDDDDDDCKIRRPDVIHSFFVVSHFVFFFSRLISNVLKLHFFSLTILKCIGKILIPVAVFNGYNNYNNFYNYYCYYY